MKIVLFVLLFAASIAAQENQPVLFDEFGGMPLDEFRMRTENLAREVKNIPKARALVRIDGGQKDEFSYPYLWGSVTKSVWKLFLKQPLEDLSIQFCNINQEPIRFKFYVVRENDKVETCSENLTIPKETVLFETSVFDGTDFRSLKIPFNSVENEYPAVDSASAGSYSEFAQNILKNLLKDSPGSRVYIIGYLNTNFETDGEGRVISRKPSNLDKKSKIRKMFRAARKELLKNGFSVSQLVMIDGGYINGNERRLEFWFVPQGGEIPIPKPDHVPGKSNAK